MKNFFLLLSLLLASCSTLMSAGAAAGGAALGSLAGPGGAAVGAAGGVVAVELIEEEEVTVIEDSPASAINQTAGLVETVGLWYLLIFVLVPFLTKRGRGWIKNFTQLHANVSREDIEEMINLSKKEGDGPT